QWSCAWSSYWYREPGELVVQGSAVRSAGRPGHGSIVLLPACAGQNTTAPRGTWIAPPCAVDVRAELAAKVAFLTRPEAYAESAGAPPGIERVETHMSRVFLTDRPAYKLKKPVRYDFLEYSTVDARRRSCVAEVRLNRRLAADVYLGIA